MENSCIGFEGSKRYGESKRIVALIDSLTESTTESSLRNSSCSAGSSSGRSYVAERSVSSPSSPPMKSQILGWPLGQGSWRKSSGKMKKKTPTKIGGFGFKRVGTETSEVELLKERMAKLLLGEDMSGSGEGVCPALAISNAITDLSYLNGSSTVSDESERTYSYSSQSLDDVEAQMRRLRLELKQTMDMYSSACREALTARHEATELQKLRSEEEKRLEEIKMTEETAISMMEKERAKAKRAMEAAEAANKLAEVEAKKRLNAEMKQLKESDSFSRYTIVRYRKYTVQEIEEGTGNFADSRKVGEGGYGFRRVKSGFVG